SLLHARSLVSLFYIPSYPLFIHFSFLMLRRPPRFILFPYTTLFRSGSSFDSLTRKVQLTKETIEANKRFFESADEVPRYAYSKKDSEEHTSELQSRFDLVCRLLLEKKKIKKKRKKEERVKITE